MERSIASGEKQANAGKVLSAPDAFQLHGFWIFALVLIPILFSSVIRLRLLELPLERDEGEYAYLGHLMLRGVPPYLQAYTMKLPGVCAAYALIMSIFGETIAGIHIGLILVNTTSIILVFLLARRLFDSLAGIVAASSFAILSLSPSVLGMAAHATHFVALATLGGLLLLLSAIDNQRPLRPILSGLLLGLAFVLKQPAIFFIAFGGLYLFWTQVTSPRVNWENCVRPVASYLSGALVPFGVTCLALLAVGVFRSFWFWTVTYASQYVSEVSAARAWQNFTQSIPDIIGPSIGLWSIAGAGLILLWSARQTRKKGTFVTAFLIFSFLAVCPGWFFRRHYFIVLLPAIALLTGSAVSSARNLLQEKRIPFALDLWLPVAAFLTAVGCAVYQQADYFFALSPQMVSRAQYQCNPFPESLEIANYIKTDSEPNDRIAVIGSEPQIYFYANRRAATGYIYTYGLMEEQKYALTMQQEMIAEIEALRPKYLVYAEIKTSWLRRTTSNLLIFEWLERYRERYDLVGIADILSTDQTVYHWGHEAKKYSPSSECVVYVYKLKL